MTVLSYLKEAKEGLMSQIARSTSPENKNLREVVEDTNPEDVDLETLKQVASGLRQSQKAKDSVVNN